MHVTSAGIYTRQESKKKLSGCHYSKMSESPNSVLLNSSCGDSLVVQWLRLHASNTGGVGSIPDQGTGISHGTEPIKN